MEKLGLEDRDCVFLGLDLSVERYRAQWAGMLVRPYRI